MNYSITELSKQFDLPASTIRYYKKIGAAKYLLSYNDYSCTDIAKYLGFTTESHFSSQFSKSESFFKS